MANRRKGATSTEAPTSMSGGRISVSIEPAENGSVIHASHEGKNGYQQKTMVAPSHPRAIVIAVQHLRSVGMKAKGKKGGKRKVSSKKAI